ncbi:MAG: arylsulfotransferase family protein [Acidobacteriota bacterium]
MSRFPLLARVARPLTGFIAAGFTVGGASIGGFILGGFVLAGLVACGGASPDSPSDNGQVLPSEEEARQIEETTESGNPSLDELRALPYAGYSRTAAENPEQKGVSALDREASAAGYNLTTFRSLCSAELLTPTGHALRAWSGGEECRHWANSRLLPNGDLLVIGMNHPEPGQRPFDARFIARFDWSGELLFQHFLPVHHDAAPGPGESLFVLAAGYLESEGDGRTEERLAGEGLQAETSTIYDNYLLRIAPDGEILDRISLFDAVHAGPFPFTPQPVPPKKNQDGILAVDLFHCNAVVWNPAHTPSLDGVGAAAEDTVLLTSRHQDSVFLIDWRRGQLLWAWGQGVLSGPHDASWLPDGKMLVFDNGIERGWSRPLELDPQDGSISWSWSADEPENFYTLSRGSAQRLPNGNTLMAESDAGRALEVTRDGEIAWEYFSPYLDERDRRATIVRMRRHPPELVDALRTAP